MGWGRYGFYLIASIIFVSQFDRVFTSNTHMSNQSILLVTAHPDDETMFFGPTLRHILKRSRKNDVHLLVLSNGDSAGLGLIREREIIAAAEVMTLDPNNIAVINDPRLPDSMNITWDPEIVSDYVMRELKSNHVQTVITFDEHGVSGHPNHKAVYEGTLSASLEYATSHDDFTMMTLFSVPLWRKFLFSADSLLSRIITIPDVQYHIISSKTDYHWIRQSSRKHESQMVWYRQLWTYFSRYMIVNDLKEINFGRVLRSASFKDEEKRAKLESAIEKPIGTEGTNIQTSVVKPPRTKNREVTRKKPDLQSTATPTPTFVEETLEAKAKTKPKFVEETLEAKTKPKFVEETLEASTKTEKPKFVEETLEASTKTERPKFVEETSEAKTKTPLAQETPEHREL